MAMVAARTALSPFMAVLEPILRQFVQQNGKFSKLQAIYTPKDTAPPPIAWVYQCRSCRFYIDGRTIGSDALSGRCVLVSEVGTPDQGIIAGTAWCILWADRADDPPLGWISRRIQGQKDPWE